MQAQGDGLRTEIVGREDDLAGLHEFLDGSPGALLLVGDPGVGKTTLWEAGIDAAAERGLRVLSARPSGAEAQIAFAALIDLLDQVEADALAALPSPQLQALEVALRRAEPAGVPPEPGAISLGFLNAVRALAAGEPLLIAIDDLQWADRPSADVLAFTARRLAGEEVTFLLAKRPGRSSGLERVLDPRLERLDVGPLSLGATRRLLAERLGLALPRHLLRRVVESTLGNPLFALEVGRMLVGRELPAIGEELPVPAVVEDLLGKRVARLPAPMRRLLLAVALSAELTSSQLAAVDGTATVDDAADAGLLVIDGDRVRASHPLLAAAARKRSSSRVRRELHLELARVAADQELRARHLALGAEKPEARLAETVAEAAAGASARGARQDAVELAVHALRLTPGEADDRAARVLELAGYLEVAGEPKRAMDLLLAELDGLQSGGPRVRALLILAECAGRVGADIQEYIDRALAESGTDPALRAHVLPAMAQAANPKRVRDREMWALESLSGARRAGPDVERLALDALAWARVERGLAIDDLCERFQAVSTAAGYIAGSPDRPAAQRFAWRGQVAEARAAHLRLLSVADERGEAVSHALERLHLCELDLRVGDREAASRFLDEWDESLYGELLPATIYERCRALLAMFLGLPDEAEQRAAKAVALTQEGNWNWLEASRAAGAAALLAHEPARAVDPLRAVWEHTQREGVDDPGVFPVAPELVEALVELGEVAEARTVTDRLRELAEEQDHPWGLATAKRCEALIHLGSGTHAEAATAGLEEAAAVYGELGLRFDRARTLLLLGRSLRRRKKWAAARSTLEEAGAAFEEIGSPGWVDEVRSELSRVGARRPAARGGLTPAEQRAAELAAEGLSNKEIAGALFLTVNTVETHLSHAYAKLGVRSRAQLSRALSSQR
ncbi:MAG TPA: AAA family ATPase [Gaiellaceae bacterium]|nr:AAA family ATPase [Gaiellaceae bacterium]